MKEFSKYFIVGTNGDALHDTMNGTVVGELIRCKDCIHRPTINGEWGNGFDVEFPDGRCPCQCEDGWYSWMPRDDWFCGNGERKED